MVGSIAQELVQEITVRAMDLDPVEAGGNGIGRRAAIVGDDAGDLGQFQRPRRGGVLVLAVIAEGVETRPQLEYLRRNRCDEIQGYFFSRPLPADEMGQLVEGGRSLPPDPNQASEPPQTLLIVDDDVNVLSSLHRLFRRDGYRILTAATPAEGFELLALYPVQVIVCDQRMPIMSGTEFLSKVKEMFG
eukprot:gene45042-55098_t